MKKLVFILAALSVAATTACTKSDDSGSGAAPAAAKSDAQPTEKNPSIASVGEQMAYDKTDIYVKAGEPVTLTFKNGSTTLKHNWVLVQPGKENDVGMAGIKAGESKGFIPDDPAVAPFIIAHTKLVAAQGAKAASAMEAEGSDTVTFKAPAAGDYPYICTNAGHHTVMKGVLHSK